MAKVYASEVDGLSPLQRQLAVALAGEVAGSIGLARTLTAQAYELDDRASAMDTRRVIDLAVGVIMERAQCSAEVAFATLSQQSQHTNTPVTAARGPSSPPSAARAATLLPSTAGTAESRTSQPRTTVKEKDLTHIECEQRFRGQPLPERPPRSWTCLRHQRLRYEQPT